MEQIEVCQEVWRRINNSKSVCPDIEIGQVLNVMIDIFVERNRSKSLTEAEKWALYYVEIVGECSITQIVREWSDKTPYYEVDKRDSDGYPLKREQSEFEKDQCLREKEMNKAIKNLVKFFLIAEDKKQNRIFRTK